MRFSPSALLLLAAPSLANAQTLQEFSTSPTKPQVLIFASGNAKSVIAQPKDATSTSGSVGMTYRGAHFVVSGVVNIPPKPDTVTSGYGASLLAPASGSTTSALLDIRWPTLFGFTDCTGSSRYLCRVGLHSYVAGSGTRWGLDLDADRKPRSVEDVSAWATGLGVSYRFFDGRVANPDSGSRVGMSLDVLSTLRTLRGNLGMPSDSLRRLAILGTTSRVFGGGEFGLNLRYNETNAALTYYHMAGSIKGFSGGQIVAAISFRTTLNAGQFFDKP